MDFFRLDCDFSKRTTPIYAHDIEADEYNAFRFDLFYGKPVKRWATGLMAKCNGNPSKYDFIPSFSVPAIVSAKTKRAIQGCRGCAVQFLPVGLCNGRVKHESFYILHVTVVCSSINPRKTPHDTSVVDGGWIIAGHNENKIVLSRKKLLGIDQPIFREKKCESILILREDLVDQLQLASLRGFSVEQLSVD